MTIRAVSYGGGVQSTALLVLAVEKKIDYRLFLFANVGDDSEHPATIAFVRDVATPYAAANGIELATVQKTLRTGVKDTLLSRIDRDERSIPIPMRLSGGVPGNRTCTAEFKITVVAKELKRRGATKERPATLALGISLDEFHRMTEARIPHERHAYPLVDLRMDRAACVALIERSGLPVPPKSACWFCPYKRKAEWRRMRRDEPNLFWKAVELEQRMNERRAALGKDVIWLTDALRPLDEVAGDAAQLDLFESPSCDTAGYCMA